ncbi:MAG TPA: hypothetical protein VJ865_02855 [Gemmatimonadaceae bacterium]|nr:hypothetical protein [Gemmatimonadaceae bacterium]
MKLNEVPAAALEELGDAYRTAAAAQGQAVVAGDHKVANRHSDLLFAISRELRGRGEAGQSVLLPLLNDSDESVRSWAAADVLEFVPELAVPVLEVLAETNGLPGLNAKMTLQEWRNGRLSFQINRER